MCGRCSSRLVASSLINFFDIFNIVSLRIIQTVFDCIRKVDSAVTFKAHCFFALSVIVRGHVDEYSALLRGDCRDLVEKTATVVETHIASLSASDELDMFLGCALRLLSASMSLSLRATLKVAEIDRLLLVWRQIPRFTQNKFTLNESAALFPSVIPHDSEGVLTSFLLSEYQSVVEHRRQYSARALAAATTAISELVERSPLEACKVNIAS